MLAALLAGGRGASLDAALRPLLEQVGERVAATAVVAVFRTPDGMVRQAGWYASPTDETALARTSWDRGAVAVDAIDEHVVVSAQVLSGNAHWGTLYVVSRGPPRKGDRKVIKRVARQLADVAEVVAHQENLRETAAAEERNRIARDLHDSVSQTLYSIAMIADAMSSTVGRNPTTAANQARLIRSMTLGALGDVRILLLEMRQSAVEAASLGHLVGQLATPPPSAVHVELDIRGELRLPTEVKLVAYRIAQEAVTNARRHAAPGEVHVRLRQSPDALGLSIVDDGRGFDAGAVGVGRHGLEIMRERAAGIGGQLKIRSTPGEGTTVRFTWRVANHRGAATGTGGT